MEAGVRRKPPKKRNAKTSMVHIGDDQVKVYLTVGLFDDGTPCEVFLKTAKSGSTLQGAFDTVSIMISHALQFGMPVDKVCSALVNIRFMPMGHTDDPDVPRCDSISDYVAKKLAFDYLPKKEE